MRYFLQGYYGYRNRGDELLFFGVIHYLFAHYDIKQLSIEVEDASWMEQRLHTNPAYYDKSYRDRIIFVQKGLSEKIAIDEMIIVLGGGEVLTDEVGYDINPLYTTGEKSATAGQKSLPDEEMTVEGLVHAKESWFRKTSYYLGYATEIAKKRGSNIFPRVGRNYFFRYRTQILAGNVIFLGGITPPKKIMMRQLYNWILPKAKQIVCREIESYTLAKKYTDTAILHRDFAIDALEMRDKTCSSPIPGKYCILNVHKTLDTKHTWDMIRSLVAMHPDCQRYFFSADIVHDAPMAEKATEHVPGILFYDWTQYSIDQTCAFIANAKYCIGSRLHILLLCQHFETGFFPLVYAHKIRKLVDIVRRPLFVPLPLLHRVAIGAVRETILAIRMGLSCTYVCGHIDDTAQMDKLSTLDINQQIRASNSQQFHQIVFQELVTRGDRCQELVFVVGGPREWFDAILRYCFSLGKLHAIVVFDSEEQAHWHSLFPSVSVIVHLL